MQAVVRKIVNSNILYFFEKQGVKFPVNMNLFGKCKDFVVPADKASSIFKADLGSVALTLSKSFKNEIAVDIEYMEKTFLNQKGIARCSARAKSAGGTLNKLEKGVEKGKVTDFESARAWVTDGKGLRVEINALKRLNRFSINKMINKLNIEGRELSIQEKTLLKKYIYSEHSMTKGEIEKVFPIFEKFITPLVEQHSKPVYDAVMLSMIKHRMINEGLTIKEIRENGLLSDELIEILTTKDILPRNYEILNNYRGEFGIPVFSNKQVQMMRKASGGKLIIHSRPDMLEYSRHPHANVGKAELGIKDSGYQGAQFKVANNSEDQYRGIFASKGAEVEHSSYDAVQKKFTDSISDEHVRALSELTAEEKILYNEYKSKYYNAWARKDIGLPYKYPKLPAGFSKELSMEYIEKIHEISKQYEKLNAGFVPHFASVA